VTTITRVKLGLTIVALLFFAAGMRTSEEWLRWVGIALLALAVLLRFVERARKARERD